MCVGFACPVDAKGGSQNTVLRRAGTGDPDGPLRIAVEDVEVSETETRTQAAVALLVDTSFSMVMENRWLPMKRTALALHHLVSTRFRSDALQIIAFGRYARTVTAAELTGLEGVYEQGTNLHHALLPKMAERKAGRIVNIASDAARVGSSGEAVYAACKGGLVALSKTLAREHARHNITVNVVCPGPTDTALFASYKDGASNPEKLLEAFTRSNIGVSMYVIIALLGCVAAVLGIYGDLFASVVKRQCGIKDYGTIFPGHGGILDRFDSVMFIAPFVTMVITAVFYY